MKFINIFTAGSFFATTAAFADAEADRDLQQGGQLFPSGFNPFDPTATLEPLPNNQPEQDGFFVREYVAITPTSNVGTVIPSNVGSIAKQAKISNGGSPIFFEEQNSILGTQFYTSGDLFNSVEIQEVNRKDERGSNLEKFVGDRFVSEKSPSTATPGWTWNGSCTTVRNQVPINAARVDGGVSNIKQISGHTCLYDLCITPTSCALIYSGTPFVFDLTSGILPPGFSAIVVGGTDDLAGIKGTAEILTVTGRTEVNFQDFKGLGSGEFSQQGSITQKIFLVTNTDLPLVGEKL
jgi:hypothetical protein